MCTRLISRSGLAWAVAILATSHAAVHGGRLEDHSNPVSSGAIVIDGQTADWTEIPGYAPDTAGDGLPGTQDWVGVWIAHDDHNLYLRLQRAEGSVSFSADMGGGSTGGYGYWVILDTDRRRSTGLTTASGRTFSVGGEYNFGGAQALNAWNSQGGFVGGRSFTRVEAGTQLEIAVPLATLGDPDQIHFVLVAETSGDYYPDQAATTDYFRYTIREPPPPPPRGEVAVRSNAVPAGSIRLDGQLEDWTQAEPYPPDAVGDGGNSQDYVQAWIAHDEEHLYLRLQRAPQSPSFPSTYGYWVFLDTDCNPLTGLTQAGGRTFATGAEYNLASILQFNGWSPGGCHTGSSEPYAYALSPDGLNIEIRLPWSAVEWASRFCVIFVGEHSGDYYPDGSDTGSWFRYTTLSCGSPAFDDDHDGDVDQIDFGMFQACLGLAPLSGRLPEACRCFDANADRSINGADVLAFQKCASGPGIPGDPQCEAASQENGPLVRRFVQLPDEPGPFPEPLAPGSTPGFAIRGIKGWNWTPEQYRAAVPYLVMGKMNFMMNCYLSIFRAQGGNYWWTPLPASTQASYQQVIDACRENGIEFCFCMHPQLGSARPLDPTSDADFEQLWPHYAWAQSAGVQWFCVSLDDISGVPIVGAQHASLVNRLLSRLRAGDPEAQVVFCPTYYWGNGSAGSGYLQELRERLHPEVYVFWTGDAVVTPSITASAAAAYKAAVGHKLILWDNYPVNDGNQTLHLGPVVGRDPELRHLLDGYMSNPLFPQDQANRLPMLTCADYAYNPLSYDPFRSSGQVIAHLAAKVSAREVLRDLVEAYPGMVHFECGTFGSGYNPVRQNYLRLARDASSGGAYLQWLRDLSIRLSREFPDAFQDAKTILDADIAWVAADHESRTGG